MVMRRYVLRALGAAFALAASPSITAATNSAPMSSSAASLILAKLRRKAIKGHGDERAQLLLGFIHRRGWLGVEVSNVQANCWFRQAAARGNPAAQRQLARAYAAGIGVRRNEALSLALLQRAAAGDRGSRWHTVPTAD